MMFRCRSLFGRCSGPTMRYMSTLDTLGTVGLTEDQCEFQRVAKDFADNELTPYAEKWDEEGMYSKETLQAAAGLGFGGLYVNPKYGGSGLGRKDGAVVFEALSTGCVSTTSYLTIHNMCCWLIDSFANEEQKQRWLPSLCSMDSFASYCLTEPGSGSDAASLSTKAERKDDHFVLNGSKAFISGAPMSDNYIVMARSLDKKGAAGVTCFMVEKGTEGLSFGGKEKKMGWRGQPTAAVTFEDCKIPLENVIGKEGDGFKIAMKALDGGRINIGACSLGGAQACLDKSLDHVQVRKQFGKPLADFQSIQFKLADMATELQAARYMVHHAAELLDAKDPRGTMSSAMAKRFATDLGSKVCDTALQLHGGYGYLQDYHVERFVRDLRVHQILEGTNEVMRVIISRQLLANK